MWPILWCLLLSNDNYLLNILSQPNQPELNILSQPNQPQLDILLQTNQPQLDILSQANQPHLDILSQPNQPQHDILSQPNQPQHDILSQPKKRIVINKETDLTYLRFAGFLEDVFCTDVNSRSRDFMLWKAAFKAAFKQSTKIFLFSCSFLLVLDSARISSECRTWTESPSCPGVIYGIPRHCENKEQWVSCRCQLYNICIEASQKSIHTHWNLPLQTTCIWATERSGSQGTLVQKVRSSLRRTVTSFGDDNLPEKANIIKLIRSNTFSRPWGSLPKK